VCGSSIAALLLPFLFLLYYSNSRKSSSRELFYFHIDTAGEGPYIAYIYLSVYWRVSLVLLD
jgi:hypothetical protein